MSFNSLVLTEMIVNKEDVVIAVPIKSLVLSERMVNEEDVVMEPCPSSTWSYLRGWSEKRM